MSCVLGELKVGDLVTHCEMSHADIGTVVDAREEHIAMVRWPTLGLSSRHFVSNLTKVTPDYMGRLLSQ